MRNLAWNSALNVVRKFALSNSLKSAAIQCKAQRYEGLEDKKWESMQGNIQKALCQKAKGAMLYRLKKIKHRISAREGCF